MQVIHVVTRVYVQDVLVKQRYPWSQQSLYKAKILTISLPT